MQFPYLDLGDYSGPRDLSPEHIQAILNRPRVQADAHVDSWIDWRAHLEFEREEEEARERMQEERDEEERQLARRRRQYQPLGSPLAPWNEL